MPTIAMKSKRMTSGKEEVLGHGCYSRKEMQEYCDTFPGSFEIVEDDFDFGTYIPEDQQVQTGCWAGPNERRFGYDNDGNKIPMTPARREAIEAVLAALTAAKTW